MQDNTGVRCIVESEKFKDVPHPSWLKCKLHERFPLEDSFFVFDADIVCLRPWNPFRLFNSLGRPFLGVQEDNLSEVFEECKCFGIAFPKIYLNGGLTIYGREHIPIWEAAWTRMGMRDWRWQEQTPLNMALLELDIESCRLPRWFNLLAHNGNVAQCDERYMERVINLHACGLDNAEQVAEFQKRYM
jgi:hypothetical protein